MTIPISAGILQQRDAYLEALTSFRAGHVEPILREFADGAFPAIANGRTLVADLEQIQADWRAALVGVRSDSAAHRIAPLALEHPVLNSRLVRDYLDVSDRAVFNALDVFVDRGVLRPGTSRQRNRLWSAPPVLAGPVLAALDGFAARSMRRT